ncbi:MAG: alpha/beta hydrolase [Cyanobacteria bacterium J06600_6]
MLQKLALNSAIILTTIYLLGCLLLRWGQSRLIFFPDRQIKSTPQKYGLDYQDVWLDLAEDKVHGWWIPAVESSAPALMYFHGNASNLGDLGEIAAIFHQLEVSVLLIDYRGYGQSSLKAPNEARVYEDAEAGWKYLTQTRKMPPEKIFVYGHSLGGAIALDLAVKQPEMGGLITEGTFTSIEEMAGLSPIFKLFPLSWIVTQRFDSIDKIGSLQTPILILHGTSDRVIPVLMAHKLFAAAPQPKQIEIFEQAGHNNLPEFGTEKYLPILKKFIDSEINDE